MYRFFLNGKVYLVQMGDSNFYKIGVTKRNIKVRIDELKTANPEDLHLITTYESENYQKIETWLHRKYRNLNKNGEWFQFDDEFINNFTHECEKIDDIIKLLLRENPFYG